MKIALFEGTVPSQVELDANRFLTSENVKVLGVKLSQSTIYESTVAYTVMVMFEEVGNQ